MGKQRGGRRRSSPGGTGPTGLGIEELGLSASRARAAAAPDWVLNGAPLAVASMVAANGLGRVLVHTPEELSPQGAEELALWLNQAATSARYQQAVCKVFTEGGGNQDDAERFLREVEGELCAEEADGNGEGEADAGMEPASAGPDPEPVVN